MTSGNHQDSSANSEKDVEARRCTRLEFERMIEAQQFEPGERLELIDGEILKTAPHESAHGTAISLTESCLRAAFGLGFTVRLQLPLAIDPYSEPEPDVAVVHGAAEDYPAGRPSTALLVIEVADTTLVHDRMRKGSLYARAGIAEYWIVNLVDRRLEIYREPAPAASSSFGWAYAWSRYYGTGQNVMPLACPGSFVAVSDLLP